MTLKLVREHRADPNKMFAVVPFGKRVLSSGVEFDFDDFFENVLKPTCNDVGMDLVRSDEVYGQGDVADSAWYGIQLASVVLVDFTLRRPNVAAEFALALAAGKHIIVLTQNEDDIPSDVLGHYRYIKYADSMFSSRRLIEELKREIPAILQQPSTEMVFVPIASPAGAASGAAEVIVAEKDFVLVKTTDDGRRFEMTAADADYRRIIPNMAARYPVGSVLHGSVEIDLTGRMFYTLVGKQTNPWPAIEAKYAPGTKLTGVVDSVRSGLGVFVHVAYGVNGLIPESRLEGRTVNVGDEVEVAITSCDSHQRRIGLRLDRVKQVEVAHDATSTGIKVGDRLVGIPVKVAPEGEGGYILLEVEERDKPVMLHCTAMSDALRADLNNGHVDFDEEIDVQVIKVERGRIAVRDVSDEEYQGEEVEAA